LSTPRASIGTTGMENIDSRASLGMPSDSLASSRDAQAPSTASISSSPVSKRAPRAPQSVRTTAKVSRTLNNVVANAFSCEERWELRGPYGSPAPASSQSPEQTSCPFSHVQEDEQPGPAVPQPSPSPEHGNDSTP
jgi:hypothetical protein